jgi:hypothetical protein
MQYPIVIKPKRLRYLSYFYGLILISDITGILLAFIVYGGRLPAVDYGVIIGSLLIPLVAWLYDEKSNYKRLTLVVNEKFIRVPYKQTDIRLLSPESVDRVRTSSYRSKHNLNNWIGYTFWLVSGESCFVNKHIYDPSHLSMVLKRLDGF